MNFKIGRLGTKELNYLEFLFRDKRSLRRSKGSKSQQSTISLEVLTALLGKQVAKSSLLLILNIELNLY